MSNEKTRWKFEWPYHVETTQRLPHVVPVNKANSGGFKPPLILKLENSD